MVRCSSFAALVLGALQAQAITIYTSIPTTGTDGLPVGPTNTNTAVGPAYTGYTAYNLTKLTPPPLPNPMPNANIDIRLYAGGMTGLSIPLKGTFFGYSIELSVANQFVGRNSSRLNVPFLNYLSNIRSRAGAGPTIRIGGNSQENTQLFLTPFPDYEIINKTLLTTPTTPTATPEVDIDIDILYLMNNVSALLGVNWYLGLPFAYPVNITGISEMAGIFEDVLGDNLIALQLGNEPDLYGQQFRKRPFNYWIPQYVDEWNSVMPSLSNNSLIKRQQILLAPSICCNIPGNWSVDDLFNEGFIGQFNDHLAQLSVQHYPQDNCVGNNPPQAQDIFPNFLRHDMYVTSNAQGFLNASATAQAANKPFIMFETNTASCSGFTGISDSFGGALWAVDWAMQLAFSNFTNVLFHFGGQNAAYNAFTPPPSNYSSDYQWTTGAIYYSNLVVAEALGSSNISRVVDLQMNTNNIYTPGYAIYENNQPARALLINYMNDNGDGTGAYTGYIHIGGVNGLADTTPTSVTVRYLAAPDVSEKFNITWAGQTLGGQFESDGRLTGNLSTVTVQCSASTGCPIRVPAPGVALVFMSSQADSESSNQALETTFTTSYIPAGGGPTADQKVLATSNGRGGPQQLQFPIGSTSKGKFLNGGRRTSVSVLGVTMGAMACGAALVGRMLVRASR